ncbi:hypothetical protein [Companilactobacillus mishanensis]|uniref:Uncharacterized protein n=1 Tax=Companilactobacillus mishanensis TaxID=2486008 RepID=A0ABW9P514_9LACO|nr:hypothetical protein [Companilactobacillus mishanensis]MQS44344.1 hypothetical protein [Companilactobacillus mishanensis]
MLGLTMMIIGLLVAVIPIFWIFTKDKTNSKFTPSKKSVKYFTALSIMLLASSGVLMVLNMKQSNEIKATSIRQQQEKKKENNDPNISDSKAQIKKINDEIASSLKDDQNHLTGKSDVDPGYKFSDKVESIKYLGNKKIIVQVNKEFLSLDNAQKKSVIDSAQECGVGGIMIAAGPISNDNLKKGLYSTVKFGKTDVGHSKKSNFKEYKWSDNISK